MKHFTLDGQKLTALEFYLAAKKKYQWRGLVPSYLVGYKSPNGDKGTQRNPHAPSLKTCTLIDAALADLSDDDLAVGSPGTELEFAL